MKPTPLNKFRIPAYRIAEMSWGEGGTHAYNCNRRGAYYYSCSGHGGYVVDGRCLTKRERTKIKRHIKPISLKILVQHQDGQGAMVIGVDSTELQRWGPFKRKSYRYSMRYPAPEWRELPIYLFEEDCDWAVLEKLTDIRAEIKQTDGRLMPESRRRKYINETFNSYYRKKN